MAGERMNIGHNGGCAVLGGCTANAPSYRDPAASYLALEGSEEQLAFAKEIEPCPVEIGQGLVNPCGGVGGVDKPVAFGLEDCVEAGKQGLVGFGLGSVSGCWFG